MKYTHVIFDWDGTIGMTLHLWLTGYREALQNQGHTFPDAIIARDFFYEHDKGVLKYPDIDFVRLIEETRRHVFSHLDDLTLYDGVPETLHAIKESGITLALVSSSTRQLVEKGLTLHKIDGYFASIICGDDVTKHKPDPEAFEQTMANLDASPMNTMIIGDAKTDILAGQAAGVSTCLFTPTENALFYDFEKLLTVGPDAHITNMNDFLHVLHS